MLRRQRGTPDIPPDRPCVRRCWRLVASHGRGRLLSVRFVGARCPRAGPLRSRVAWDKRHAADPPIPTRQATSASPLNCTEATRRAVPRSNAAGSEFGRVTRNPRYRRSTPRRASAVAQAGAKERANTPVGRLFDEVHGPVQVVRVGQRERAVATLRCAAQQSCGRSGRFEHGIPTVGVQRDRHSVRDPCVRILNSVQIYTIRAAIITAKSSTPGNWGPGCQRG